MRRRMPRQRGRSSRNSPTLRRSSSAGRPASSRWSACCHQPDAQRQLPLRPGLVEALAQARLILLRRAVPEEMALAAILVVDAQRPAIAGLDQRLELAEAHGGLDPVALRRARAVLEIVDQLGIELDDEAVDELRAFQALLRLDLRHQPVPGTRAGEESAAAPAERRQLPAQPGDARALPAVIGLPLLDMGDGAVEQRAEARRRLGRRRCDGAHPRQRPLARQDPIVEQHGMADQEGRHAEARGIADAERAPGQG